jgi:hypothetical protein
MLKMIKDLKYCKSIQLIEIKNYFTDLLQNETEIKSKIQLLLNDIELIFQSRKEWCEDYNKWTFHQLSKLWKTKETITKDKQIKLEKAIFDRLQIIYNAQGADSNYKKWFKEFNIC